MRRASGFLLVAGLCGCAHSATAPGAGSTVDVPLGSAVTAPGTGVLVRFDSIPQDSRCPIGAMCVWAGKASVAITVGVGLANSRLQLTSTTDSSTQVFSGWFFDYVDLMPYPSIVTPPPGPKVLRLTVRPALD